MTADTPTPTPTQEQIAEAVNKCRRLANPDQDGGKSVGHLWSALDEAADLIEALAAQLAEAQTTLRAAKRVECDVCEKRIALNRMVSDLGQKHRQAEAAAASARETALEEVAVRLDVLPGVLTDEEAIAFRKAANIARTLKQQPAPVTPPDPNAVIALIRNMPVGASEVSTVAPGADVPEPDFDELFAKQLENPRGQDAFGASVKFGRTMYRLALTRAPAPREDGWRAGDNDAKSGDLIEAIFEYRNVATQQDHRECMIVWWNDGRWEFADGQGYDGPSSELPSLYRRFQIPSAPCPTVRAGE